MITCNFMGGLGNNLFQLAMLYNIHKTHNIPYYIKRNVHRPLQILGHAELELDILFDNKFTYLSDTGYDESKMRQYYHHCYNGSGHHYAPPPIDTNVCHNGYYQSEKYFSGVNLLEEFEISKQNMNCMREKYKHLFQKSTISLHLRFHSAHHKGVSNIDHFHKDVSSSFYKRSLDIISKKEGRNLDDYNILLFSGDLTSAVNVMRDIDVDFIPIDNGLDNIKDFTLMSMCDHNVLGNSTFSWWASYLNPSPNKIIIAPKTEWFGPGYKHYDLEDAFPDTWVKI